MRTVLHIVYLICILYCVKQLIPQIFAKRLVKAGSYHFMYVRRCRLKELIFCRTPGKIIMKTTSDYIGTYNHFESVTCYTDEDMRQLKHSRTKMYDVYTLPSSKRFYMVCDKDAPPKANVVKIMLYTAMILLFVLLSIA